MGKWKSKIVSSPRGKVENAWELAILEVRDGYLPSLLVAAPVGAEQPAFAYPLSSGIDVSGLLWKGLFENPEFPTPSQVLVSDPDLVAQLRPVLGPKGVSVLLQKRLPTLARIEENVFASLAPPAPPGVVEDLDEWREFGAAYLEAVPSERVNPVDGYVVEGGEFDGSCVQFTRDLSSTLFGDASQFELASDRGLPTDATVVRFQPTGALSEEEEAACESAGLVFSSGLALSVEHVLAGYPTQISGRRGAAHRVVVGSLLAVYGDEPDADGRLAVPDNGAGITAFRRIQASERARRERLPTDADCYPVADLAKLVAGEAPAEPAIVIEAFMDETDECAALLDQADRLVVEECVGCHEQRILAFLGDTLIVEAGRIYSEDVVELGRVFDDGNLLVALVEVAEDVSHLADELAEAEAEFGVLDDDYDPDSPDDTAVSLIRQWSLPYEIAWVDHEGNPVEKHTPKPVRSQSVRGRARTTGRNRN